MNLVHRPCGSTTAVLMALSTAMLLTSSAVAASASPSSGGLAAFVPDTTRSPIRVNTTVGQADSGRTDIVRVRLSGRGATGAVVTLYRRVETRNEALRSKRLDDAGTAEFRVRDLNERRLTKYFVVIAPTDTSLGRRGPVKQVR